MIGVGPPDECLDGVDPAVGDTQLRLEVDVKLVAGERIAEFGQQVEAAALWTLHARVVVLHR